MTKRLLLGLSVLAVFAVAPAGALAVGPHWWGKTTGPLKEIPPAVVEKVATSGTLTAVASGVKVPKCVVTDEELIENPLAGGPGVDEMTAFSGTCAAGKTAIFPCLFGESEALRGVGPPVPSFLEEPSALTYLDKFTGAELEVECLPSTTTAIYKGNISPTLLPGKLVFSVASGVLKDGTHNFSWVGNDKLTGATYKKIQGK